MKQKISQSPILFFSFAIVVIFLIFTLINALPEPKHQSQIIVLLSLSAIAVILLLSIFLKKGNKFGKLLVLLYNYCTPAAFIREVSNRLRLEREKKQPIDENILQLFLSNGLYAAGKFEEAMETLECVGIFYHYKNAAFIANYFHRKFLISLEIERQDVAWGSLVMMRQAIGNIRERKVLQIFTRIYNEDMYILNVARGNYEGAEAMFYKMFKRGPTNYERSFASFLLGGVYTYLKKETLAKYYYKYTVELGNKLYIADKAAKILGLKSCKD